MLRHAERLECRTSTTSVCVCVKGVGATGGDGDRLYELFNGVKFHLESNFGFNLNKTLHCIATHLVSRCSLAYRTLALSLSLALSHTHTQGVRERLGSYRGGRVSEVLFLYCSHISFWPTFFKLPVGLRYGERKRHIYR